MKNRKKCTSVSWALFVAFVFSLACTSSAHATVYLHVPSVPISWESNTDSDLRGYAVYRSNISDGSYVKVNSGVLSSTSWTDTGVANGSVYYYEVRAIDLVGNESGPSAPSDAVVIDTTSPTVSANPPAGVYSQGISVTLTPSETATICYTTDGSTPMQSSPVYTAPIEVTQTMILRYLAVDSAGNQSAVTAVLYVIGSPSLDSDNDGYTDIFEQLMGTNPLDPASQPSAANLTLSSAQGIVRLGGATRLSVDGTFVGAGSEPTQYDMRCLVQYKMDTPNIVTVDSCGNVVGQSEGTTSIWAEQIVNGQTVASSNTATITVDATPPSVDTFETHPYDGQGMNEDTNGNGILDPGEDLDGDGKLDVDTSPTPRVPNDTGIVVRVADNLGIDTASISMLVGGTAVPVKVRQFTLNNAYEADIVYQTSAVFEYDQIVNVELSLADIAGNTMDFKESFQIESLAEHEWALSREPVQATVDMGDGTSELSANPIPDAIDDEQLDGAKVIYNSSEPIKPRFGPVDELPPLDVATPAGIPMNLEPANEFDNPVTLIIPVPGAQLADSNGDGIPDKGLEAYDIYQYTAEPTVLWRNVADVPGWAVEGSRVNHYETVPPSIEIKVYHFSGVQIGCECLPPQAGFSAYGLRVEKGDSVQFKDSSIGTVTGRLWSFGDGATSTWPNPAHVYDNPGTYTIGLTVTGPCGSTSVQKNKYITVTYRIQLSKPVNQSRLYKSMTAQWTKGANNTFQVQISRTRDFSQLVYESTPTTSATCGITSTNWKKLPSRVWLYWRVKGWNSGAPGRIHYSAQTWEFMKYY